MPFLTNCDSAFSMVMYCSHPDSSPQALQDTAMIPRIPAGLKQRGHLTQKCLHIPSIRRDETKWH